MILPMKGGQPGGEPSPDSLRGKDQILCGNVASTEWQSAIRRLSPGRESLEPLTVSV
jgi:hypothetical protein